MQDTQDAVDASSTLLDRLHSHKSAVRHACYRLEDMAAILDEVGMERQAKKLDEIAAVLYQSIKLVMDAYGDKLTSDLHESQAATGNMLLAILGGFIGPKASPAEKGE